MGRTKGDSASDSTAEQINQLRRGEPAATEHIWKRYFDRLVRVAQRRLGNLPRRAADEEDVALSAMNSFVKRAQAGGFPELTNENSLWRLLVTITSRKASAQRRRHFAARRSAGKVRGESIWDAGANGEAGPGLAGVAGSQPTPQFAVQMAEQCRMLFDRLDDPSLRDIARWKMEGYTNEEIAAKLGRTLRTVERKLALIRQCWGENE